MLQQGAALLAGGRYHEAVQAVQQALRQEPASVPARMGLARALSKYDKNFEVGLRGADYLTRDSRMKERKKYGQRGARRRFQFSKR